MKSDENTVHFSVLTYSVIMKAAAVTYIFKHSKATEETDSQNVQTPDSTSNIWTTVFHAKRKFRLPCWIITRELEIMAIKQAQGSVATKAIYL